MAAHSKRPTWDLLDADLQAKGAEYDGMEPAHHYAIYGKPDIIMSPTYWKEFGAELANLTTTHGISWTSVRFSEMPDHLNNALSSVDDCGVYLFVARPGVLIDGLPGLVFYVGIAGEHDSGRPLRKRLAEYLNFNKVKKRKRVHQALRMYHATVEVLYSRLNLTGADLARIERCLHGHFMPWACDRDFPAEVQQGKGAW